MFILPLHLLFVGGRHRRMQDWMRRERSGCAAGRCRGGTGLRLDATGEAWMRLDAAVEGQVCDGRGPRDATFCVQAGCGDGGV